MEKCFPDQSWLAMPLLMSVATLGFGQEEPPDYKGPDQCILCHDQAPRRFKIDYVMLNESLTWLRPGEFDIDPPPSRTDKHYIAFETLKGGLGRQMGQRLWQDPDVTNRKECLSCHAGAPEPHPKMLEFGVSCESCHGPSSEWSEPHAEPGEWRSKSPAEKKNLGMVDVRDPEARARQCYSCHIGDAEQNRVVTHDMYAAGHPPLPSIEVETFAEMMPKHWRYLPEKGNFTHRNAYLATNFPGHAGDPAEDLPRTKNVIVGAAVALDQSLKLNAALVLQRASRGFEFAAFECSSCHHNLRPQAWRQLRGNPDGRPGRPPMHGWPIPLVKLGIQQVSGADEQQYQKILGSFETRLANLREAYTAQPFGSPEKVDAATKEMRTALASLISTLRTSSFDEQANHRALVRLKQLAMEDYVDFHSARQISWATIMLLAESSVDYPDLWKKVWADGTNNGREDVEAYVKWRDNIWNSARESAANAVQSEAQLVDYLALDLPAGQEYEIEEFLPRTFEAVRDYDPEEFRQRFSKLKLQPAP